MQNELNFSSGKNRILKIEWFRHVAGYFCQLNKSFGIQYNHPMLLFKNWNFDVGCFWPQMFFHSLLQWLLLLTDAWWKRIAAKIIEKVHFYIIFDWIHFNCLTSVHWTVVYMYAVCAMCNFRFEFFVHSLCQSHKCRLNVANVLQPDILLFIQFLCTLFQWIFTDAHRNESQSKCKLVNCSIGLMELAEQLKAEKMKWGWIKYVSLYVCRKIRVYNCRTAFKCLYRTHNDCFTV